MNISHAYLTIANVTAEINTIRINAFHFKNAILVPIADPIILAIVIGKISDHIIAPVKPNNNIDPKFDHRLSNLEYALALKKSYHSSDTNHKMSKLPDQGPRNQS